jgi:hypothetical protein
MKRRFLICILSVISVGVAAQNNIRKQLDSEREGSFSDVKTYEKAKRFIRADSTYYLGYLLEGSYLFYRANDRLGFKIASEPLKKALAKIENDYDALLRTRSNNYGVYSANYKFHYDYGMIAYYLCRSYQNMELENEAMEVLRHIRDRNFQLEIYQDSYNTIAWLYHRNRMYTSKRFHFLKNTVMENVRTANKCLDSALLKMQNDFPVNNGLYDPSFINRQYLSTFHYKALIYDYLLNIDSANYYYDILIQNNAYSSNNYAEFKLAMGEFEEAEMYFKEAEEKESGTEKNTKEYYYMRGTLDIYRGHPEQADTLLTSVLKSQGSTPGYGWHSIGLARAQHYEGLTAESQNMVNKAARFQELHINTTWGQEQYNMAVASLNYINQHQFKKEYWFEHNEWYFWLNPLNWYRWIKYTLKVRHHKMLLASLVAENPEREQVLYTLFSPENLMSFDEVLSVTEGFGNEYFIDIYKHLLQTDKRPRLKRYFRYVLGRLYQAEGKSSVAIQYYQQALQEMSDGDPFDTMLRARSYEGLAAVMDGAERRHYLLELYKLYPQLVPFTSMKMAFRLNAQTQTKLQEQVVDDLRSCSINFTDDAAAPLVTLSFKPQGQSLDVHYTVQTGAEVTQQGVFTIEPTAREEAGKVLAYRIFGIQKNITGEEPVPETLPAEEKGEKPV